MRQAIEEAHRAARFALEMEMRGRPLSAVDELIKLESVLKQLAKDEA